MIVKYNNDIIDQVCTNPIPLTYQLAKEKTTGVPSMSSLMQEQDDAACPFKVDNKYKHLTIVQFYQNDDN